MRCRRTGQLTRELLPAVQDFRCDDVMAATTGGLSLQTRVAANILAIVDRELTQQPPEVPGDDWPSLARSAWARLAIADPERLAMSPPPNLSPRQT